jgi:hypothetical protein
MTSVSIYILGLINEGLTLNQIMEELNIDRITLLENLKSLMLNSYLYPNYLSDGNITYSLYKKEEQNTKQIEIYNDHLKTIFISDLHLGHQLDGLEHLDDVYNYAIKNNIHIIMNGGDLLENTYVTGEQFLKEKTIESQIEYAIKQHPFDKNIINFILYGNHDYYSLKNSNIDIAKLIEQERFDLVSLGYLRGYVKLKSDYIILNHKSKTILNQKIENLASLCFSGHSHRYKISMGDKKEIHLPTLSFIYPASYDIKPLNGFLDVEFSFNSKGYIHKAYIKQMTFQNQIELASETEIILKKRK